jgi:DNA polymerase-3 subunit alpha
VLRAFNKPHQLAAAAKQRGLTHLGLCDFGTLSASVEFVEACQKENIIPILGCDLDTHKVFARNLAGWHELILLVTCFAHGQPLDPQYFGSDNLLWISDKPEIHKYGFNESELGLHDCRYISEADEESYRILRAMANKTTLAKLEEKTSGFHFSANTGPRMSEFLGLIAPYSFFTSPKLPGFIGDKSEIELLRDLVETGFKNKVPPDEVPKYRDRIEKELKVIELNNLAGYFLIVQDFIADARKKNVLVGPARGSAAGSLVSYLIGITLIDPIPYGLLFSRFFNAARSYPKHLSFDECPFVDVWRDVAI